MCIHLMNRIQNKLAQFNDRILHSLFSIDPLFAISIHGIKALCDIPLNIYIYIK